MPEEQIDLRDLVEQVWARRWLIAAATVLFVGCSAIVGLLWPKSYQAVVVMVPASDQPGSLGGGGGGSLGPRLGGLAALAGLGGAGGGKEAESLAVLESQALAAKYIDENQLLPLLFEKSWDPVEKAWKTTDPELTPSLWLGGQVFRGSVRSVKHEADSGLILLTVKWKDPEMAARWANGLVALANSYLRDRAIADAERNIAYLTEQAQGTNIVEVRQAMYGLLEGELNKVMLARGTNEYAFRVIDPAVVPERPTKPSQILILGGGVVIGLLFGIFLALVELAWKRSR